jgi:4-hydroxy-4-methyl-2-oxoglutarate aldolase
LALPAVRIGEVLAAAAEIHNAEEQIRAAIEVGTPLREARAQFNYHALQTRRARVDQGR